MNLTELSIGEHATIKSFDQIKPSFRRRLMDLGIYESAHVILLNRLSFGRLYLIEVDEIEICLRSEDAALIEVSV
jgi:ferrous iron transport protein A